MVNKINENDNGLVDDLTMSIQEKRNGGYPDKNLRNNIYLFLLESIVSSSDDDV